MKPLIWWMNSHPGTQTNTETVKYIFIQTLHIFACAQAYTHVSAQEPDQHGFYYLRLSSVQMIPETAKELKITSNLFESFSQHDRSQIKQNKSKHQNPVNKITL